MVRSYNDLMIRRAVPDDAEPLAEFATRIFIETFGPDNTAEDINGYIAKTYGADKQTREITNPAILTLIDVRDSAIVAFAQLRLERDAVEIARFYVDRALHGQGIAQTLMHECLGAAAHRGIKRVWLGVWEKNRRAIAFYEKCGFRDIGSQPFLLGSDLQTDRLMDIQITTPSLRDSQRAG
jgi:ribosomal protein S18 acetylase RimI-like enzyme